MDRMRQDYIRSRNKIFRTSFKVIPPWPRLSIFGMLCWRFCLSGVNRKCDLQRVGRWSLSEWNCSQNTWNILEIDGILEWLNHCNLIKGILCKPAPLLPLGRSLAGAWLHPDYKDYTQGSQTSMILQHGLHSRKLNIHDYTTGITLRESGHPWSYISDYAQGIWTSMIL